MNGWNKALMVLAMILIASTSFTLIGCGGNSDEDETSAQTQIVPVTRGNLRTTISAIGAITMPHQADLTFGSGGSTSTVYTVNEINVKFGDSVKQENVLARLDTSSLQSAVTQAQANLRTAQINLEQASSETNILKAQATLGNAEISLANAEKELADTQSSLLPDAEATVRDAQLALDNAQRTLNSTQTSATISIQDAQNAIDDAYDTWKDFIWANFASLTNPDIVAQRTRLEWTLQKTRENLEVTRQTTASNIATAKNNVTKAEETLKAATDTLEEAQADSLTIKQKQVAVTQAKATLLQSQDDLAYAEAGYNIEQLQLQVDNAQADLDDAQALLESATLTAPFDGVISSVNAIVGDEVTANTTIVHLVDINTIEVDASVDEIDVSQVKAGLMAMITLDALPNAMLRGTVSAVSPLASSQSGVVSYPLTIEVINAEGVGLRDGMSATIEIVSVQAENVLLVPSKAISRSGQNQVVQAVIDEAAGQTEQRVIQTGETNGTMTEITSGLAEGEQVKVNLSSTGTGTTIQFPGGFNFPGGGPGGGGREFRIMMP